MGLVKVIIIGFLIGLISCGKEHKAEPNKKQTVLYRLKVVDKDGSFIYSKTIRVDL